MNRSLESRTTFPGSCRESTGMKTDPNPNPEKPTDQWVTGEEPMTGPQISYLQTLCREAGEEFDADSHQGRGLEEDRGAPGEDRSW